MRELLRALYDLQKIDSDALEFERSAAGVLKKIEELEFDLEKIRAELGASNSEVSGLRREQQDLEGHLSEEGQKHRKWKQRLNEIRSPREYQALSRELEQGERQVRDGEEKVLALLQQIEDKQKQVDEKTAVLKEREAEVGGKVRELRQGHVKLLHDAQLARSGRDAVKAKVPDKVLKRYDQLRGHRNGMAVALIVDGACMGCNVRLRPQHLIEILRLESMEQCSLCQRILVPDVLVKPKAEETAD